jgi:hypothetical protein
VFLSMNGFSNADPSHPLGGPDGLKDLICERDGKKWIAAAYFPKGQKGFKEIRKKFEHDLKGVEKNSAEGIAFVTNQELSLGEREELGSVRSETLSDIFHLERLACTLNTAHFYGVRLEFLDIEMTKEDQLSFFATVQGQMTEIQAAVTALGKAANGKTEGNQAAGLNKELGQRPSLKRVTTFSLPTSGLMGLHGPKPQRCNKCEDIFLVDDSYKFSGRFLFEPKLVRCPSCSKVQTFSPLASF